MKIRLSSLRGIARAVAPCVFASAMTWSRHGAFACAAFVDTACMTLARMRNCAGAGEAVRVDLCCAGDAVRAQSLPSLKKIPVATRVVPCHDASTLLRSVRPSIDEMLWLIALT